MFYPISMQAQTSVREDDIVAAHKVASEKINHACNDSIILIIILMVHFWSHQHTH